MKNENIAGRVISGLGDGQNWEPELIALIRNRTGFERLIPGTLNIAIPTPRHSIRCDYSLSARENPTRPEGVTFELCCLSRNGLAVRALWMRTTTDYYRDHKILEFMAEFRLREILAIPAHQLNAEIEITFYRNKDAALVAVSEWHSPR